MRNFALLAQGADVTPLRLALHRHEKSSDIWKADTYLRDYPQGPFGDCDSVILRFPPRGGKGSQEAIEAKEFGFDQHESVDLPAFKLLPEARPLIFSLMTLAQGERLGRCVINRLKPGGRIFPHADSPEHAGYYDRFHIVLQSLPGNTFQCGGEEVQMRAGDVWWFDNLKTHSVTNNSADDRVHLVVDIRTSK